MFETRPRSGSVVRLRGLATTCAGTSYPPPPPPPDLDLTQPCLSGWAGDQQVISIHDPKIAIPVQKSMRMIYLENLLTSTVKKRTHVCRACLSVPVEPCPRLPTSISRRALLCSLPSVLPPCAYARHALPWGRQCPPPLCPQPATPLLAQTLQPPSSCCLNAPFPLPWNARRLGRNQVGSLIREVIAEDT